MVGLVLVALAGFVAQLVDGSLGMAFGVTATTGLLAVGTAPAVASASVHLAEIGTAVASGASHWRLGNVDWKVVGWLAAPGAVGGFVGATALSSSAAEDAEPWMSGVLITLGVYVLLRFTLWNKPVASRTVSPAGRRWLVPLGLVAGFVDATGGGGWGPISTSTLLSSGRLTPRRTIGSVDTSEVIVALGASAGFLLALGHKALSVTVVGGLLIGGVIAAPLAAYLVRILPTRMIGAGAGGLIVLTNVQVVLDAVEPSTGVLVVFYGVVVAAWVLALVWALRETLAERKASVADAVEEVAPVPEHSGN
jgi:uncharacterized membrane protein YfcA